MRTKRRAVLRRGHAGVAFEDVCEVALVVEADRRGDFAERRVRARNFAASRFDSSAT